MGSCASLVTVVCADDVGVSSTKLGKSVHRLLGGACVWTRCGQEEFRGVAVVSPVELVVLGGKEGGFAWFWRGFRDRG